MNKDPLIEHISNMEDALERINPDTNIWQNKIIRAVCAALWYLLTLEYRRRTSHKRD